MGCSRVVCPGFHRIGNRVGIGIGSRIDKRKRARSRRPGPAASERRSSRRAGCHQPDPPLPTTGSGGRSAVTPEDLHSRGRQRGQVVLEPRGSKWSKWVQGPFKPGTWVTLPVISVRAARPEARGEPRTWVIPWTGDIGDRPRTSGAGRAEDIGDRCSNRGTRRAANALEGDLSDG